LFGFWVFGCVALADGRREGKLNERFKDDKAADDLPPTHNEQGHDEVQRSCTAVIDAFDARPFRQNSGFLFVKFHTVGV
jgi:hypothetical protein